MKPYLVVGAGAVGSSLAGYLARRGHPVTVVARPDHAAAISRQGGIRVVSRAESFLAPVEARDTVPRTAHADAILCLTVQVPDVRAVLETVKDLAAHRPLVTWQNGVRAEAWAAASCPQVYGGVVRFTSTRLVPGEVRLRAPGELIVGRYPEGRDAVSRSLVEDLAAAGFTAAETPDIRADKALKLLVNLVSGPAVLLRRTGAEPALARVQRALLEEAARVYAAAGIDARPASGLGETLPVLLSRFAGAGAPPDTAGGIYNSTWQNLHHRRPRLENVHYHGEIVELGRRHGIPAPVNARALELLEEACARNLGPEPYDAREFRERFAPVVDFTGLPAASETSGGSIEI